MIRSVPALLFSLLVATAAAADDPQQTSAPKQTPEEAVPAHDENITVVGYYSRYGAEISSSAIRLEVPLAELPQSVGVVTQELMSDQGIKDLGEVARNVAGLGVVADLVNSSNQFMLRGYLAANFRDGFRLALSDLPKRSGASPPIDPFTIDTIEVVRGPSAIMFGRGNPGGAINLVSKQPRFEPSILAGLGAGTHENMRLEFDATGPLVAERLAYRIVAAVTDRESHRDEVTSDFWFVRPSLTWTPAANVLVQLSGETGDWEVTPEEGVLLLPNAGRQLLLPAYSTRSNFYGGRDFNRYQTDALRGQLGATWTVSPAWELRAQAFFDRQEQQGQALFSQYYNFNGALRVVGFPTSSTNHDVRGSDEFDQDREDVGFRLEAVTDRSHALGSLSLDHQLLASLEYGSGYYVTNGYSVPFDFFNPVDGTSFTHASLNNPIFPNTRYGRRDFDDRALVLQDYVSIGTRWSVLAGVRYEEAEVDAINTNTTPLFPKLATSQLSDDEIVPRLGIHYEAGGNVHLWTSYSESYTPSLGQLTRDGLPVKPESGAQTEVGARWTPGGGRLMLSGSLYEILKTDVIIPDPTLAFAAINGGEEEVSGAEIEAFLAIGRNVRLTATATQLDQEFTTHPTLRGNTRYGVPETSGNVWGTWRAPFAVDGLTVGGGARYIGEVWNDDSNSVRLPDAVVVDAMVSYDLSDWRLQLNFKNITDELYYLAINRGDARNPTTPIFALPSADAEVDFRVQYRF